MSELKVPADDRSKRLLRLSDVWLTLEMQADFSPFAEDLGLVERVLRADYRTGLERGLKDLIPFAETCELPGAPQVFARPRKAVLRLRDEALAQHEAMVASDEQRMTDVLQQHPGLVLVTNPSGHPYAEVTSARTETTKGTGIAALLAYSGSVALHAMASHTIVCDVERLPNEDMRTYISDVLL